MKIRPLVIVFLCLLVVACARGPIKSPEQAMRPTEPPKELFDDMAGFGLKKALERNIDALQKKYPNGGSLRFGPREIGVEDYLLSLKALTELLDSEMESTVGGVSSFEQFKEFIKENFEFFEIYGRKEWGEVFMTSYYEPHIEGSKKKTKKFSQALYGIPKDMVIVDLNSFADQKPQLKELFSGVMEQKSKIPLLRGRLIKNNGGSAPYTIKPYFDRQGIDEENALKGQGIELAWVDPVDSFFLQIQGSGVINFSDGSSMRVGYASQNGHKYVAIGSHLFDVIPREKMSMQAIENYLNTLSPKDKQRILNLNPSYVFFQPLKSEAIGYLGAEVTPGRTIATDYHYFPKGGLAFLEYERPEFETPTAEEPISWKNSSRFVLDQDTGGAIRGPDRLDLFWGGGAAAKQVAGVMKNYGTLYYLVPRPALIESLKKDQLVQP